MKNYKVILQYEGTRYQGWQRQESTENTLQGRLEALLSRMAGTEVPVQGSGRTDAGVHAYGQVINFHMDTKMTCEEICAYMNRYLPEDVAVIQIEEVSERFHSRLNAKGKVYRYRIWNDKIPNVFERRLLQEIPEKLDVEAMRLAADRIIGTHDFKAFTSAKKSRKSTVRTIDKIEIVQIEKEIAVIFYGNGFLYHMVRILMGTLIEVGTNQRKPEDIDHILTSGDRENAGALAPAKGLALMEVIY